MKVSRKKYYEKDFRTQIMLLALMQMMGMLLIPIAVVVAFFSWKIAVVIGVLGALMFWKFGDLNIKMAQKWIQFSGESNIKSKVLYCDIEDTGTAGKFKFVPENMGGIFRENDEMVLGSLSGEARCNVKDFEYEIINKSALVNYIKVKFSEESFALCPKWDGEINKHPPTSAKKVEWGAGVIQELLT